MKKIKILTIWLLSLWLLGNIFSVADANNACAWNNCWSKTTNQSGTNTSSKTVCKWIKLNTNFPFVGSCIGLESGETNQINVFPKMVKSLMKLIISIIMLMSLIIIIIAGVMVTSSGYDSGNYKKGLDLINKVATGLALLGASGVILKLINPNFFT